MAESIEDLEEVKNTIEHLANLSLEKGIIAPVKTTFNDLITDVRKLSSYDYIDADISEIKYHVFDMDKLDCYMTLQNQNKKIQ